MYDWWREPYHTPLNSSMVSWTGDISHIWKKFKSNDKVYLKKYPHSIDEFYFKEINYETFDKVCYSIKGHEYDKEANKDFSICKRYNEIVENIFGLLTILLNPTVIPLSL